MQESLFQQNLYFYSIRTGTFHSVTIFHHQGLRHRNSCRIKQVSRLQGGDFSLPGRQGPNTASVHHFGYLRTAAPESQRQAGSGRGRGSEFLVSYFHRGQAGKSNLLGGSLIQGRYLVGLQSAIVDSQIIHNPLQIRVDRMG